MSLEEWSTPLRVCPRSNIAWAWVGGKMTADLKDSPAQRKALDVILDAWDRDEQVRTVQELADKWSAVKLTRPCCRALARAPASRGAE